MAEVRTQPLSLLDHVVTLQLSTDALAFLLLLIEEKAWTRTAQAQARRLNLSNRDALRSLLYTLELPSWRFLRRWLRVYSLVLEAEHGHSFAASALADGHNPSSAYRMLERFLDLKPGEILQAGGTSLLLPLLVKKLDQIRQKRPSPGVEGGPRRDHAPHRRVAAGTGALRVHGKAGHDVGLLREMKEEGLTMKLNETTFHLG